MPNRTVQVSFMIDRRSLRKLDNFAEAVGSSRSGLIRELVENFAEKSSELVAVLTEAKKGAELESVHAWAETVVERAEYDAQLSMPTGKGRGR